MTISLKDRVAVVTGAGGGLGRSHALMLASRGAKVVVNDLGGGLDGTGSSSAAADRVVAEIEAAGGTAVPNYDSISEESGAAALIDTAIKQFGRIDILVNNAGFLRDKTFAKADMADFRAVVGVHFLGAVYCTSAAFGHMRQQKHGRIVMTSSGAGLYGNFGQSNYGAAKMALVGLMNVLKQEGARDNVLINTIAPIAATRMTEAMMPPAALPHLKAEAVSSAVTYLSSDECTVSGHVISAGAGYFARAAMMEGAGVFMDDADAADPDAVAAAYERIADLSHAEPFASAPDYITKALARFEPAETH
ncbi:SDR family NAD(P)-dependent oxidoreductase [Sphingomonas crusticola]|uniref:SDR family NAD(P)-dependent oxidoreductase n=1 Tax=Sphingomonas crusticola TaxID=1697973 RepID=UPI000E271AB9|nr:SDR family NAD(P)-dependent oxidoreductase [Sphingomonas crusticola]